MALSITNNLRYSLHKRHRFEFASLESENRTEQAIMVGRELTTVIEYVNHVVGFLDQGVVQSPGRP